MNETKRPRGAPKKENPASALVKFRCTPDEKTEWEGLVSRTKFSSLSELIRALLNEAEL